MFLNSVQEGSFVIIKKIFLERALTSKLFSLGIFPGIKIQILKNDTVHALILIVGNARVVVERDLANKIEVAL
jgi:Fe2+ transport system protein FeoA